VHGNLGQKRLADVIREIAQKNASGLLRLTGGKTIKAIFFESGNPVFAISNVANEQLDHELIKEGLATRDQLDQAKQRADKPHRMGQMLVEMGVVTEDTVHRVTRQLATQIVLSLFEWTQGEFVFDERMRAVHEATLTWSAYDCILEGARHAARITHIAQSVVPDDGVLEKAVSNGSRLGFTGKLSPLESYVLSRVESSTQVSELGAITGLGEQESREAVCALISAGLLKVAGQDAAGERDEDREDTGDLIADEIARKMHFFAKADYYDILGVTRRTNSAEIKTAYYKLAKKYHPDRYRHPDHRELRTKLEALFSKISEAYDTLSDGGKRAAYDELTKHTGKLESAAARLDPGPRTETTSRPEPGQERPAVESSADAPEPKETGAEGSAAPSRQAAVASARPVDDSNPIQTSKGPAPSPAQMAEYYHQQGRARTEQKDYYGAVQLLREAVKLDNNRPHYHYHLGVALLKNPRTRREGEHHLVKAAELDPFNAQIRVRLGLLYKEAGLPKKAEFYFRAALAIDPENRVALRESSGAGDKKDNIWKSDLGAIAKKIFKK
jgi:curved DNA-binding protein CbpA